VRRRSSRQPAPRRIERRRIVGEHRRHPAQRVVAFGRQLIGGLGNAEGERRDDVVRRDRADLVQRRVGGRRRREQQVRDDREHEREQRPRHVDAQLRAP
jgi:hypothetical protein